ncbi:MAG: DUF444 family protein [Planctomycetes bacterium]|nr:DUF444 family protein [Planctomycetota bacterium]
MVRKIDKDHARFRRIVHGAIRQNLKKYVSKGEMIGRKGKNSVSIPLPQIDIPRFRFGARERGGVGQGEGENGTPISGPQHPGTGPGEAGEMPGEHDLEVEVTLKELAEILGEELELPNIQAKGRRQVIARKDRYTGIRLAGPESLRHFKRTFRQALKRQIALGAYDPGDPKVIPIREDKRYRSWNVKETPDYAAVIIHMMDVSGSMGDEQKEIVRITAFWIDTWLRSQYKALTTRYIVHDAAAKEVDEETFYHLRESGGTKISSAYDLCNKIIDDEYAPAEWNIYPFHFSDGDNWGTDDTERCVALLRDNLLPKSNMFCYGQVRSVYGSGKFKGDLDRAFDDDERIITTDIADQDGILPGIQAFLGKGR